MPEYRLLAARPELSSMDESLNLAIFIAPGVEAAPAETVRPGNAKARNNKVQKSSFIIPEAQEETLWTCLLRQKTIALFPASSKGWQGKVLTYRRVKKER